MDSNKTRRLSSFHTVGYPTPSPQGGATPKPRPRISRILTSSGDRRASFGVTPKTPRVAPAKLSREDVAQLYSETIKLSQDNKITAKNTWSLQLIDYMGMLVRGGPNGEDTPSATEEETNFQLAGVALDAGIRIYCSRVDSVHTNAFKVLGGLSRTTQGEDAEDGNEADGDDGDDVSQRAKRRPRGGATLAPNVGSVTVRKLDTDLAVDPLFQKMSEAFDEGSVQGMLANRLLVASDGYIQFDSAEKASPPVAPPDDGTFDPGEDTATFSTGDAELCPDFMAWVDGKGVTQQIAADVNMTTTQSSLPSSQVAFEYDDNDAVVDASNAFMPAMDAGDDDNGDDGVGFDDDAPPEDPDAFEMAPFDAAARLSDVSRAPPPASDLMAAGVELVTDSDYAFFDASSLAAWAGPSHWTYRQKPRAIREREKRPRTKTAMLLDYSADAPDHDFEAAFRKPEDLDKAHELEAAPADERKTTLPVDLHYETADLTRLFLLPACRVALGARGTNGPAASPGDVHPYDYDNALDQNYDEPLHFYDDDDDPPGDAVLGVSNAADAYGGGDQLVPLPSRVEKLDIGYATVAKKVDVRKLKSGMWSHLCGGAEVDVEDAATDVDVSEPSQSQNPDRDIRTQGITQSLADVVQEMPEYLPPAELEDVTFPYVFICLLHLANEKTLRIEAKDNVLDDLVIRLDAEE